MKLQDWALCLFMGMAIGGSMGCGDDDDDGAAADGADDDGAADDGTADDGAGDDGAGGDGATDTTMSFFVTSRGGGTGGDLGGLEGADALCATLAGEVSDELGQKTWRAYLSTSTVDARDRIGAGPWRNAAGEIIANTLDELHDQLEEDAALNATWPVDTYAIALDENGQEVPADPLAHDILTGTDTDGTVADGATCNDWTSQASTDLGQVGHSNRAGGGRPPSWNAAHTVGCAEPTEGMNFEDGTVSQGGGRGSFYCFAVP